MNHFDKLNTPHAVYRIYSTDGELLYVGGSVRPLQRLSVHARSRGWAQEIASVKVAWYPGWLEASSAEMNAINTENPRHNKQLFPPDRIGHDAGHISKPRGDGRHCPRCGGEKENRLNAYCLPCAATYQHERKRRLGWEPYTPTVICPRCHGPKEAGPNYCKPCMRAYSKERYALKKSGKL